MHGWSWADIVEPPPPEDSAIPGNPCCDADESPSNPYCEQAMQTTLDEATAELASTQQAAAPIVALTNQHRMSAAAALPGG